MAIILKFSILLIILLAFAVARETVANNKVQAPTLPILLRHTTVYIINKVKAPNPTPLTLRCQSKDDDLEEHTIHYKTQVYSFKFTPNFLPIMPTLFFCSFRWHQDRRRHYLDVFNEKHMPCDNCTWVIHANGGCLNGQCIPWKSIH
ncbi:putative plant self-incompatibility S1 [Medicago truncatula]|uniref:S-protein homolog n=1 Tax=Medicago truncatula TaxID=3880 RepID=A0A072UHX0_MEDTR|nr:leguminosin group486 secreted peptide [Medicago truncatula]RHN59114.1 putative plant self-incompatibility S1 [Medicago truncatula]